MSNNNGLLFPEGVDEADDIPDQLEDVVRLYRFGPVGAPVAALIGGNGVKSRIGQGRQLVSPAISQLRKAVAQDHQRAFPLLGDVHGDAVGFKGAVTLLHRCLLSVIFN